MKPYRFSPIADKESFKETLEYLAKQLELLSEKVLGERRPIDTLKIFSHYFDEYDELEKIVRGYGPVNQRYTKGLNLYVDSDLHIGDNHIHFLGVRQPDPHRLHVGCGDFGVMDFEAFRAKHLNAGHGFVRDMPGRGMLELWHPDFDVLGYIVPEEEHQI